MQTFARLFGQSPFSSLQTHMDKVAACVHELVALFAALADKNYARVEEQSQKISKLENEADLTKNDIRNHLPPGLILQIPKQTLLEILTIQDDIADRAEDIGVLLTFRELEILPVFAEEFQKFLKKNLRAFESVYSISKEMSILLESTFGGAEAEKVRKLVDNVALQEHESDLMQRKLLKKIFHECETLPAPSFILWLKVIQAISAISDESEKLANRVRMILEIK